jgi:hypothetical protein
MIDRLVVLLALGTTAAVDAGSTDTRPDKADASTAAKSTKRSSGHCSGGMAYVPALTRVNDKTDASPVIREFCMDVLETTQAEYLKCVKARRCTRIQQHEPKWCIKRPGLSCAPDGEDFTWWEGEPNYPVIGATLAQATAYCRFRSKRLPTADEWLRAAGGNEQFKNPWGRKNPCCGGDSCRCKWQPCNVGSSTLDVSPFGLHDMGASAVEWISDNYIFSHGNPGLISLRGRIDIRANEILLGQDLKDLQSGTAATGLGSGQIGEAEIEWLNGCDGRVTRDKARRKFATGAEIWLILCHGTGGHDGLDAGDGTNLVGWLADTFQVQVCAFTEAIWYWPDSDDRTRRITGCELTSVGKTGDKARGYYSAEEIYEDGKTKHHRLGRHMATSEFLKPRPPTPGHEPLRQECFDEEAP